MKPLRIVHAIPFFDPATRFGGPVAQLRAVCAEMASRGHDVRVVTTALDLDRRWPSDAWVERDGYRVWYGTVHRHGQVAPYFAPGLAAPLRTALTQADVLHLGLALTHVNLVAAGIADEIGVPYVYSPRSGLDPIRLAQRRLLKMGFLGLFERRLIRGAAVAHALTEAERGQIAAQGAPERRIQVVPNAATLADTEWPDGAEFRQHIDAPADAPLILFMGRLQKVKGLDLLVNAFASVAREFPTARLILAGPDEGGESIVHRHAAAANVSDRVRTIGCIDGRLRLAALRAADVFALTSYSEGLPNAVLEACSAGTAVLITEGCHLPEVASWGAGCVEPPETAALTASLRRMLEDPMERTAMGRRGLEMIDAHFTTARVVDVLFELYMRAVDEAAARGRTTRRIGPTVSMGARVL